MAVVGIKGFEIGDPAAYFTNLGGTTKPTADASTVHTGNYSMKCVPGAYGIDTLSAGQRHRTDSFYFMLDSVPAGASAIIWSARNPNANMTVFVSTAGVIFAQVAGGATLNGGTPTPNAWHRLDVNADCSAATYTIQWSVDGTAKTNATFAPVGGAADLSAVWVGQTNAAASSNAWIDDVVNATANADYPLGGFHVLGYTPNSTGTHVTPADFDASGTTLGGADTTSWQAIDDVPPATVDYVEQQTALGTAYLEYGLQHSVEASAMAYVNAIAALASNSTGTNNAITRLRDGATDSNVYSGSQSGTAVSYQTNFYATKPSTGAWTLATFNALLLRYGFSTDVAPPPRLVSFMAEAAYADSVALTVQPTADALTLSGDTASTTTSGTGNVPIAGSDTASLTREIATVSIAGQVNSFQESGLWGGGFVNVIAPSPLVQDLALAGGETGGVYRSTDHGDTWVPQNLEISTLYDRQISDICWHPTLPNRVFRTSGDGTNGSFWESTDQGQTWTRRSTVPVTAGNGHPGLTATGSEPKSVNHLIVPDPTNGYVYVATYSGGVYRAPMNATSGVGTFTLLALGPNTQAGGSYYIRSLVADSADSDTLYASTYTNPAATEGTTLSGRVWRIAGASTATATITEFANSPKNVEDMIHLGTALFCVAYENATGDRGLWTLNSPLNAAGTVGRAAAWANWWNRTNALPFTTEVWYGIDGVLSGQDLTLYIVADKAVSDGAGAYDCFFKLTDTAGGQTVTQTYAQPNTFSSTGTSGSVRKRVGNIGTAPDWWLFPRQMPLMFGQGGYTPSGVAIDKSAATSTTTSSAKPAVQGAVQPEATTIPAGYAGDLSCLTYQFNWKDIQDGVVQTVTISATAGTFKLAWNGTACIATAFNATAATLQTNLRAIAALGTNVAVTGSAGGPYTVTLSSTAAVNPPLFTADATLLTGASHSATVQAALSGPAVAIIDTMLTYVAAQSIHAKLRMFTGGCTGGSDATAAPPWVVALAGTYLHVNSQQSTPIAMARFWTAEFQTAYDGLMALMAARWDANASLADIAISGAMMRYAEPFIRDLGSLPNRAVLVGGGPGFNGVNIPTPGAGYNPDPVNDNDGPNQRAHKFFIDSHAAHWTTTNSSLAFNPYQRLDSYNSASTNDVAARRSILAYFKKSLGQRGVIENNSVGPIYFTYDAAGVPTGLSANVPSYTTMYQDHLGYPPPYFYQSENNKVLSQNLQGYPTIQAAMQAGAKGAAQILLANAFEYSSGVGAYSASSVGAVDTMMKANPLPSGSGGTSTQYPNKSRVFIAGDGGPWRTGTADSAAASVTFFPAVRNMGLTANQRILADPNTPTNVYTANADYGFIFSTDGMVTVDQNIAGFTQAVGISLAVNETATPSIVYLGVGDKPTNTGGDVYQNTNPTGAATWTSTGLASVAGGAQPIGLTYLKNASNTDVLIAAVGAGYPDASNATGAGIYRKVGAGAWAKLTSITPTGVIMQAEASRSASMTTRRGSALVYLFDGATGLWRSPDYGVTWLRILSHTASNSAYVGFVASHPTDNSILYLSLSTGIFQVNTADTVGQDAAQLTNISGGTVASPGAVKVTPTGNIYVVARTTPPRLWRSTITAPTAWSSLDDAVFADAAVFAQDLDVDTAASVYIATNGIGIIRNVTTSYSDNDLLTFVDSAVVTTGSQGPNDTDALHFTDSASLVTTTGAPTGTGTTKKWIKDR